MAVGVETFEARGPDDACDAPRMRCWGLSLQYCTSKGSWRGAERTGGADEID